VLFNFYVFSQNVYSMRRESENGDKTCPHYEPPQLSRPGNAIMKTGLKRFAPADHRYYACRCRNGLISLAPLFPSIVYQIYCKIFVNHFTQTDIEKRVISRLAWNVLHILFTWLSPTRLVTLLSQKYTTTTLFHPNINVFTRSIN